MTSLEPSLLNALRYRDRTAMREVVKANHGFLIALLIPLVGKQFAEDVALDTWMKTLAALDRFERRGNLRMWLAQTALSAARSKQRLVSQELSQEIKWGADPGSPIAERFGKGGKWNEPPTEWDSAPVDLLTDALLRYCIEKHMARLPPDQQTVLRLRDLELMELEEIAATTQLTERNVCALLHRARQELQAVIDRFRRTGSC